MAYSNWLAFSHVLKPTPNLPYTDIEYKINGVD